MKHPGGAGHSGAGHSAKHTRSKKHAHGGAKHNPHHHKAVHHHHHKVKAHTVAHHPHHPRGLAVGELLPVCSLEAVAMSLRLAGQLVSDEDVAGLWELAGRRELSIMEALEVAAREFLGGNAGRDLNPRQPFNARPARCSGAELPAFPALILGVDWPGPHAVLATPDGWWSWGKLWEPWTTAVSEAWVVNWS